MKQQLLRNIDRNMSQSSPIKKTEQYDTHEETIPYQQCPICARQTVALSYYPCCIQPACNSCYSGFHYLQCVIAKRSTESNMVNFIQSTERQPEHCNRCETTLVGFGFHCRQCGQIMFCELCFNQIHKNSKFSAHSYKRYHVGGRKHNHQTLSCSVHNKIRTLLTQNYEVVCADCLPKSTYKKPKAVAFTETALDQKRQQLNRIVKSIILQSVNHRNKWNKIREDLKEEYYRLSRIINDRYEENCTLLKQMEQFDMRLVDKAVQESRKITMESQINIDQFGIDKNVFVMRLAILEQRLLKRVSEIQETQNYTHKIGSVDFAKLEALVKSFTVTKTRIQTVDKQNMSVRKPTPSLYKNNSNLSISRRSLSKSVTKYDPKANTDSKNSRINALKDSTLSINSSMNYQNNTNDSINLNKQMKTQPIRNSTPIQSGKNGLNSSDKKTNLLRQSSIMTAKIQDITPVMLNFDTKESNGSRINFMSNKTDDDSGPNLSLTENDNNASQSRMSKRKSDYFELRDRMRKPNIVSNRFPRR